MARQGKNVNMMSGAMNHLNVDTLAENEQEIAKTLTMASMLVSPIHLIAVGALAARTTELKHPIRDFGRRHGMIKSCTPSMSSGRQPIQL